MKRQSTSRSSLFLMEMIVVILFFSLCAAICVHVFVNARETSQASYNLSCAVLAAQNVAECYKATGGDGERLVALLDALPVLTSKQDTVESYGIQVTYDRHWQRCGYEEAVFLLVCTAKDKWHSEITVNHIEKPDQYIYRLTVWNHEGGDADV